LSIERRLSPELLEMRATGPDGAGEQRFQCTVRSLQLGDGSEVECAYLTPLPEATHAGAAGLTALGALELDPVTGLPGRLSIARVLDAELSRSRRYENPLSALLIKASPSIGDATAAHGQALIRRTAQLVREQIRWVDKVGLWGPDELLLILPETPRDAAEQLATKIESVLCSEMLAPEDAAGEVEFSVVLTEAQRADDADRLVGRLGASGATTGDLPISA
ncbi:MAG: diguanylate cyclase, partial [Gammaproteobacteria bacterium]|nr:diguanylate cyclase [Gammaproteobacteria bacterium]